MLMKMRFFILLPAIFLMGACVKEDNAMTDEKIKTDAQWKAKLSAEQYRVTRQQGTEPAFSGKYWDHKELGIYSCVCCGTDLFLSDTKFDAGCGWPSYFKPVNDQVITERRDTSGGRVRTEVICSKCAAHLGHVFPDGPPPTGLRYCINSVAIKFQKAESP
jgi:peptide-methionine (R)-S-oxide reductase